MSRNNYGSDDDDDDDDANLFNADAVINDRIVGNTNPNFSPMVVDTTTMNSSTMRVANMAMQVGQRST